jgi:hypothetical protein
MKTSCATDLTITKAAPLAIYLARVTDVLLPKNPPGDGRAPAPAETAEKAGFGASQLTSAPGALNCRLFSSGLDLVE